MTAVFSAARVAAIARGADSLTVVALGGGMTVAELPSPLTGISSDRSWRSQVCFRS